MLGKGGSYGLVAKNDITLYKKNGANMNFAPMNEQQHYCRGKDDTAPRYPPAMMRAAMPRIEMPTPRQATEYAGARSINIAIDTIQAPIASASFSPATTPPERHHSFSEVSPPTWFWQLARVEKRAIVPRMILRTGTTKARSRFEISFASSTTQHMRTTPATTTATTLAIYPPGYER